MCVCLYMFVICVCVCVCVCVFVCVLCEQMRLLVRLSLCVLFVRSILPYICAVERK